MMHRDRISVIVPAYNIENEIERSINSVLGQTYSSIEIIVVDDGSTDGTAALLDQLALEHKNIKVIHKKNEGVFLARLEGVKEAGGEWIGFVDGDDEIEPDMYQTLLDNALKYKADISHCGYQMIFPDGHIDYYYNTGDFIQQDNLTGMEDLLEGRKIEPGLVNKLFRKELFTDLFSNSRLDTGIKINEDLLINFFLFKNAKLSVYSDKCLYHYMIRKNSASTAGINQYKLYDPGKVLSILMDETKNIPSLQDILLVREGRRLISLATLSAKINPQLIYPARKEAREKLRHELWKFLTCDKYNIKLKIMIIWAAFLPGTYMLVHRVYARLTGVDKKFSTD